MNRPIIWSVKELSEIIKDRIENKFDSIILVTGLTGLGKSTLIFKFFNKFDDFKIEDKLTYKREETIPLITNFKNSYVWADELISSANKRRFYDTEQIELIEILTKYRSNFNIFFGAVPIFFSLDKELLKLVAIHINVIDRGLGVVHLPLQGRMFSDDFWDTKQNQKLESKWSAKRQKNPNFQIPYHKYTTFAGFIRFGKMTPKQEEYYEHLRKIKRGEIDNYDEQPTETFYQKVLRLLRERKLDEKGLFLLCSFEGKKLSSVKVSINRMLKDEGSNETLKDLLKDTNTNTNNTNYLYNNTTLKEINIDL